VRDDSHETKALLARAAGGDSDGWGALLVRHAARLRRTIAPRVDPRVRGRIDPADVLQEAFVEASARVDEYPRDPRMPFFLWLRFLVGQKLVTLHRHHLGTRVRDAGREVSLAEGVPGVSSAAAAECLAGPDTRPSGAASPAEQEAKEQAALDGMDETDREVLVLRHFEHLTRAEAAQALGITEAACGKRYLRALKRLKDALGPLLPPADPPAG
jgi:RNA polymerase sigma-70 factor (ECF subfamily)